MMDEVQRTKQLRESRAKWVGDVKENAGFEYTEEQKNNIANFLGLDGTKKGSVFDALELHLSEYVNAVKYNNDVSSEEQTEKRKNRSKKIENSIASIQQLKQHLLDISNNYPTLVDEINGSMSQISRSEDKRNIIEALFESETYDAWDYFEIDDMNYIVECTDGNKKLFKFKDLKKSILDHTTELEILLHLLKSNKELYPSGGPAPKEYRGTLSYQIAEIYCRYNNVKLSWNESFISFLNMVLEPIQNYLRQDGITYKIGQENTVFRDIILDIKKHTSL